jgi:cbb3-type cytochrome oxidase subunit 3
MSESLMVVLGMTIAYAASFLGLLVAWWSYRKRRKSEDAAEGNGGIEEQS